MTKSNDVLEQNVSTLLESGGERPVIANAARTRIREALIAKHAAPQPARRRSTYSPVTAIGFGLVATAVAVAILGNLIGGHDDGPVGTDLADGSTYVVEPGAKLTQLGPRHVRVEGAVLLDVVRGKATFVVETAHGRIEVLGTKFLVDGAPAKTTAAVVRGEVKLASDQGFVLLHAGEQGVAEPGRPPTRGPAPRLSHLVSWAEQARHRDEKTVVPLHHGTLFARDPGVRSHPPWGEEYPLPIAKLSLDVVVEDQVARVALDQTFRNPTNQNLEGVYRFAIPPDAALQRLAMYVDGKLEESAVVERMAARRIYEELVYRRVDPALLEWAGTGRLSLRVYPIPALQDKRLMLAYTQSLPKLYSDYTLTIPLPEVDQPVGEMGVAMRVKGCASCELTSTSHQVEVTREGDDAIVRFHRSGETIGDSFVVHVRDPRHATTFATKQAGSDRYLLVRAPAELGGGVREYRPRTWVILDDVSASRSSLELRAQADLVEAVLGELDENDRVSVVAFDVEAREKLRPTRVLDVDHRAVRKGLAEEGGVGATDFGVALDAATRALAGVAPDDAMIVYLGDGVITSGERTLDTLRARIAGKAQFVGVGVGDGPDTQTLQALANATGGYATTIDLADDVAWRAFDLVAALHTARVTGIDARLVDRSGALVPATLYLTSPQLADGEQVELIGKLAGNSTTPAAVELTGTLDGMAWKKTIALPQGSDAAGYLPRLWAQRHVAARLLAKHEPVALLPCTASPAKAKTPAIVCPTDAEAREARDEAIRKEVVALGKQYFLLSRHTSLLVLENDAMYAQYGVTKGAGETWAPYAMPAKIPVVTATPSSAPADVAEDAELVRAPIQVFYNDGYVANGRWGGGFDGSFHLQRDGIWQSGIANGPMSITTAPMGAALRRVDDDRSIATRAALDLGGAEAKDEKAFVLQDMLRDPYRDEDNSVNKHAFAVTGDTGAIVAIDGIVSGRGGMTKGKAAWGYKTGNERWQLGAALVHYGYPTDTAFDDVTALVPALLPDAADQWRAELAAGGSSKHAIDDAARALLADARRRLPSGIYRWGDAEIAVDSARHLGWRRTTEAGLVETASFDGTTWTRRYSELGIDVTRAVGADDVALALGYLPVWIAEPAHYAKWFDVKARGAHEVVLSRQIRGTDQIAFVLRFDDQLRLVAISDAKGNELLGVTWSSGPTAARMLGETVSVGFTGQAISDAARWAHGASQPGIAVELPAHMPAFWRQQLAAQTPGTPQWRHLERQLLVSCAATQDRGALWQTYEQLRARGGVVLGELALASGGIATSSTDEQFATAVAPLATEPLARYLIAGRAYGKSPRPERLARGTHDGMIGALWSLRSITAELAAGHGKAAVDQLIAMGDRALELRLVAAASLANRYDLKRDDIVRAWDSVAVGAYRNVARAAAAQALFNTGQYDAGVAEVAKLVDDLDLKAMPAQVGNSAYMFNSSRRGAAGWQIVWTSWRTKVLASGSYAHVMTLLSGAGQNPADVQPILARAAELAGDDPDRRVEVAHAAVALGRSAWAETIVQPMLKARPSHDLYQLVGNLELQQGKLAEAFADLEAAQDAGADEAVDINTVRRELSQIIDVARSLAVQSSGAARDRIVARAMRWGARWRAIDAGNGQIDRALGELQLAIGNTEGAWRQLSSTIERDPWSGAGYTTVADAFERQGRVADALPFWEQAIRIDQTNPTPRLRKAQALIALGRGKEGDAILAEITSRKWHEVWSGVVYQAQDLIARGKASGN